MIISFYRQAIAIALVLIAIAPVCADDSRLDLERSRNSLLAKEDALRRSYNETCQSLEVIYKQLDELNTRKNSIESDMARTDQALRDIENMLKNAN